MNVNPTKSKPYLSSIKSRLLFIYCFSFVFFIFFFIAYLWLDYEKAAINRQLILVSNIKVHIREAEGLLKDFLLTESKNPEFYQKGKSEKFSQYKSLYNLIQSSSVNLETFVTDIFPSPDQRPFDSLRILIDNHKILFDSIVTLYLKRGEGNYGLIGRVRATSGKLFLLNPGFFQSVYDIRKHERNYFYRPNFTHYNLLIQSLNSLDSLLVHNTAAIGTKKIIRAKDIMTKYNLLIEKLHKYDQIIGTNSKEGIMGEILANTKQTKTMINDYDIYLSNKSSRLKENLTIIIYSFIMFVIIFYIIFFHFIKKKITTPLNKVKDSIQQVIQNNFSTKEAIFKVKTKDEVGVLSEKFNYMLDKLHHYTREIENSKTQIEQYNKRLQSSLRYAYTIQSALLPKKDAIEKLFDSFIYYKPKDVVSGDFYWFYHDKGDYQHLEKIFLTVIDCTGHGVPGAFMSVIGVQLLNEIIKEDKITDPADILDQLNQRVRIVLNQDETNNDDGMDVCFCLLQRTGQYNATLTFASAERPLFVYSKNKQEVKTLKEQHKPIGGNVSKINTDDFKNEILELEKGDILYLTTDGYVDQNNAARKRLGSARFLEILNEIAHLPVPVQKTRLENELEKFQGAEEQRDDITIIGVKI